MLHRVAVAVLVEALFEGLLRDRGAVTRQIAAEERAKPHARGVDIPREDGHLDAIAGREQHRLVDLVAPHELLQQRRCIVHGEALADLEGRAAVIDSDQQQLHAMNSPPSTARQRKTKPATALTAVCRAPCRTPKRRDASTA